MVKACVMISLSSHTQLLVSFNVQQCFGVVHIELVSKVFITSYEHTSFIFQYLTRKKFLPGEASEYIYCTVLVTVCTSCSLTTDCSWTALNPFFYHGCISVSFCSSADCVHDPDANSFDESANWSGCGRYRECQEECTTQADCHAGENERIAELMNVQDYSTVCSVQNKSDLNLEENE